MITVDLTHLETLEEFGPEIRRLHEEDNDEHYCKLHDWMPKWVEEGMVSYKELGTNQGGTASAAVLAGFTDSILIDIRFGQIEPYWKLFKDYAHRNDLTVRFREVDSTSMKAVQTDVDVLLIDSLHKGYWLEKELEAHHNSVNHYIAFHDTSTTGQFRDLYPTIMRFLERHPEWVMHEHYDHGAGYTVIKRVA